VHSAWSHATDQQVRRWRLPGGEQETKLVGDHDDAPAYGEGLANDVEKSLKGANIRCCRRKGTKEHRLESRADKVKGKNADAVSTALAARRPLLKQGRETRREAVFSFATGLPPTNGQAGGAAGQGLLCSRPASRRQAADRKFLDAYKKKFT